MAAIARASVAAMLLVWAIPGFAQGLPTRVTARALDAICRENQAACLLYVMGAIDGVVAATIVGSGRNPLCIPGQVTNQQISHAAVRHIRAHPEEANSNAATVVIVALREAYPCPAR